MMTRERRHAVGLALALCLLAGLAWLIGWSSSKVETADGKSWDLATVDLPGWMNRRDLRRLVSAMPRGWHMAEPERVAAPHGYQYTVKGEECVRIEFTGTKQLDALKGMVFKPRIGLEGFTLWIAPSGLAGEGPAREMPQTSATEFGPRADIKVFEMTGTYEVPTWPRWKADVMGALRLGPAR